MVYSPRSHEELDMLEQLSAAQWTAKGHEQLTITVATRREECWCGFHNGNEVFTTAVFKCPSSKFLRRGKYLHQEFLLHEQAYAQG